MHSVDILRDLLKTCRNAGADAADALWVATSSINVSQRMRKPEGLERSENNGISLRVFIGQQSAMVSTSDMGKDHLQELVERAVAMAKLSPADPYTGLAREELLAHTYPQLDLYDAQEPSAEWLQEQCKIAEDVALSTPGITNSEGADASYGSSEIALVASNGFAGAYRSSSASISVSVLAGTGTDMERDYDFTSARHISDLASAESIGKNAAERALARLNPRKISTMQVPILFDPRVSKSVMGYLAGAINGAAIARGTSFLKEAMGKQIFAPNIQIVDDPHRVRGLASRPFDGEGVSNSKQFLVKDGVLQSWLLDMRSAKKLGLTTTGHAARGFSSPPSPSASNLHMEPGHLTPRALMADIQSGLYITETFGMGVNLITGDYSQGASGFWIEKGERAYPVSEITIAGKLQDMFQHLTPADDLVFRYGTNAPTLRVEGMTIAGK